jgi:MoaA/NifB/PqqE/SkfB family radical SAM enzyme
VSDETANHRLSWETVRHIVKDVHDIFGSRFMTISGGEPFIYKDSGKTLLDLFEEFNDMFFLVYTNGTLITNELAQKLAKLGNVTPAISVEGYQEQTDERRGDGIHTKVVEAMANLREAGVPFGISATANKKNVDILLDDYFYDYFFGQLGVTYMWQFQMMPVGRGKEMLDLMITPRQRVGLYHMWEKLIEQKHYCVADFWNSGALTEGCLAYGRWGGYFYINWDGKIMPCVFVPFYQDNVNDLYADGKTLADGLHSKLMKNGRKWQREYGFENAHHRENILMPCSIKDNFDNFRKNILPDEAIPENREAEVIRTDDEYYRFLTEYDRELSKLTEEIWHKTIWHRAE